MTSFLYVFFHITPICFLNLFFCRSMSSISSQTLRWIAQPRLYDKPLTTLLIFSSLSPYFVIALARSFPSSYSRDGWTGICHAMPHCPERLLPVRLRTLRPGTLLIKTLYRYNFTVPDQSGTYWYHSHLATQYCDGLR